MIAVCPDAVKNGPNDYVNYHYTMPQQKEVEVKKGACYGTVMSSLETAGLRLVPYNEVGVCANSDLYLAWMNMCKQHGLIPPDVEFGCEDGKNLMQIPAGKYDRHWVYTALCCYRFADAYARLVWLVVENMNQIGDAITFWQALHYAMATEYSYGSGHNFSHISRREDVYSNSPKARINLAESLAIPVFFRKTVGDRKKMAGYTNDQISTVAGALLEPTLVQKVVTTFSGQPKAPTPTPILTLEKLDELLTPKWTPLYRIENPTAKQLQTAYEQAKAA